MAHLPPEQNDRLRAAMLKTIADGTFATRKELAEAMGVSAPSLSDFLNENGGASMATAEAFAEKVARRPVAEVLGPRKPGSRRAPTPPKPEAGYPVSPEVRRKAIALLKQPPQTFTDEGIEIGFESIIVRNPLDAQNPAAVAELVRLAILGSVASLPTRQLVGPPPAGTRRSRSRA